MREQKLKPHSIQLTDEQKSAMANRAVGLGVALTLFALILYLATFARLMG